MINSTPAKRMRNENFVSNERNDFISNEVKSFYEHDCAEEDVDEEDVDFYAEMKTAAEVIERNSVFLELDAFNQRIFFLLFFKSY